MILAAQPTRREAGRTIAMFWSTRKRGWSGSSTLYREASPCRSPVKRHAEAALRDNGPNAPAIRETSAVLRYSQTGQYDAVLHARTGSPRQQDKEVLAKLASFADAAGLGRSALRRDCERACHRRSPSDSTTISLANKLHIIAFASTFLSPRRSIALRQ